MNIKNKKVFLNISVIIFLIITFLVLDNNYLLSNLDSSINNWILIHKYPSLYNLMLSITNVGDVMGTIFIFIVFGLFIFFRNKKNFYILAVSAFSGIILADIIKYLVQRQRPFNLLEQGFSFPSSHATISVIFLLSSIFLLAPLIKNGFYKKVFLMVTSIIFPLVAFSRIYLSVHYTSDVIAGIILGSVCFVFAEIICCYNKENVL